MTESSFKTSCISAAPINPAPYNRDNLRYKGSIYATPEELLNMFGMPIPHRNTDRELTFIEWEVGFLNIWIQPHLAEFNMEDYSNNFTTKYNWLVLARPEDFMAIDDLKKFLRFINGLGNKDHLINGSPAATVSVRDLNDTLKK